MARITIDVVALLDRRFAALGKTLGFNRFEALGRMVHVWHVCQEEERYHLRESDLDDIHPDIKGFGAAVLASGLGVEEPEGLYIRGTRGRIEWLAARRADGKKGGRPHNPMDNPMDNPRGRRADNPPAPAPAPVKRIKTTPPNPPSGGRSVVVKISPFIANPPTQEEVSEYLQSKKAPFVAGEFLDGMTRSGWTWDHGRQPVRDWKAEVRAWIRVRAENRASATGHASVGRSPTLPMEDTRTPEERERDDEEEQRVRNLIRAKNEAYKRNVVDPRLIYEATTVEEVNRLLREESP